MQNRSPILSVHLGLDLKKNWTAFCFGQNVTPSAGVRQVINKLITNKAPALPVLKEIAEKSDVIRRRIELRLTASEYEAVTALAEHAGNSPNAWIVNLIRANLTYSPQFGMTELQVLGKSNLELLAIGRNLNQIARWMNANSGSAPLEKDRLDELYRIIVGHTGKVSMVMRANIDRWVIK